MRLPRELTVSTLTTWDESIHSIKLVLGFVLVLFGFGSLVENIGWLWMTVAQVHIIVLLGFAVCGTLATLITYWKQQLILTWFLVFACASAWIWHVVPRDQTPTLTGTIWADIALYAGIVSMVVGTIGYISGKLAHRFDQNHL